MKKILWLTPLAVILTACVTTEPNTTTQVVTQKPDEQSLYDLNAHKSALRACIVGDKNIQSILAAKNNGESTDLIVENNLGSALTCTVDNQTNRITKIEPYTGSTAQLRRFYPIGKKLPASCDKQERRYDDEKRLMGFICRAQ